MPTPTNTSLTTTYAGKYAGEYIRKAFLANDSLQYLTIKDNIDYKQVVKKLVDDISFAAPTCDFDSTGTVTITERLITLEKFQVQRQLCKKDFLTDWAANDAQNGRLEPALVENLIANMLGGIADKNESLVWTGVTGNTGEYDGLITLIDADNTVNFVASPLAIVNGSSATTNANILVALRNLIAEAPIAIKGATEKPIIYMSYDCWEAYLTAQIAAGNGWYATAGPEVPKFYMGRFEIAVCPGMPTSTMIMAQKSNLWFGTNVMSDWNEVKVLDMADLDMSDNVRFGAKFFAATQYGIGSEIAAYGPGLS